MDYGFVEGQLGDPFLLAVTELVVAVGEVVVDLEAPQDFEQVQQEHVDYHRGHYDDYRKYQVVVQVTLCYRVPLGDLRLVREQNDVSQHERRQKQGCCVAGVGSDAPEQSFHAFALLHQSELPSFLMRLMVLVQVDQLHLNATLISIRNNACLLQLPSEHLPEHVLHQLRPLTEQYDGLLGVELQILDYGFDVDPADDNQARLNEVRYDEALEVIGAHRHHELHGHH